MKIIFLFIIAFIFLFGASNFALALNKDEQIYTAFREILDRDPTMGEYHSFIKSFRY